MGGFCLAPLGFWCRGLRAKLTPLRGYSGGVIAGHRLGGIGTQGVSDGSGLQGIKIALHDAMLDGLRQHRSYLAMRPCAHLSFTGLPGIMQIGGVPNSLRRPCSSFTFVLVFVIRESGTLCVSLLLYKEVITCQKYRIVSS